ARPFPRSRSRTRRRRRSRPAARSRRSLLDPLDLPPAALLLALLPAVAAVLEGLGRLAVLPDEAAQGLHGGALEEGRHRDLGAHLGLDPGDDLDGEQGVAAEVEEVVLDADLLHTQEVRPDP